MGARPGGAEIKRFIDLHGLRDELLVARRARGELRVAERLDLRGAASCEKCGQQRDNECWRSGDPAGYSKHLDIPAFAQVLRLTPGYRRGPIALDTLQATTAGSTTLLPMG